ncbi:hypothetical protein R1sor_012402 [Riccia sorocarpa]|uniref:Uncharacterized protein n=1 Tax=Riccia sorocarpa TaxID=122646 RepID=A0ABD3I4W8_9MARC
MAKEDGWLYFEDLVNKICTKFPVQGVWFVTLNIEDASLVLWKHEEKDPVSLGILLKTITNTSKVLEVLAMKDGGGSKQSNYKLPEREPIKGALNSGLFGVLPKAAAHYLPHPKVATKAVSRLAPAARVKIDSQEESEIARDLTASQKHEAQRMAAAKATFSKEKGSKSKSSRDKDSQSSKNKGKSVVQEARRRSLLSQHRVQRRNFSVPVSLLRLLGYPVSPRLTLTSVNESHRLH